MSTDQVNVRFPKEELEAIDQEARKRDWTRSHLVKKAVIDYLKKHNEKCSEMDA
jgi:metal-responsive CopG/Arc/MetJ family transcriptional regulator